LVYDLVRELVEIDQFDNAILYKKQDGHFLSEFRALNLEMKYIRIKSSKNIFTELVKIVRTISKADVVHFHNFLPFIVFICILLGKKTIFTEHGNFGFGRSITLNDKFNHFLRRIFFNYFCDLVVANSEFTCSYLKTAWRIKGSVLKVIHNGTSFVHSNADHEMKTKTGAPLVIGTLSRLAGFKRIDRLLVAFASLVRDGYNCELRIVGDGPEKGKLESQSRILGIADRVAFLGYKSDVQAEFKNFDICVFPSENEPFGLVAIEAYAHLKPVLVFSNGGGLTEIVNFCDPADIVENVQELAERIKEYYSPVAFQKNYQKAIEYFSSTRMTKEYIDQYYRVFTCVG